ncbi:arylesterase [Thiomicrorhabdus immobilis]|uniref:Arylesterase n=1 Tax=Thiomicrorhabdus immobilis TaxID=2791037 RepID=A0ABM7MED5_9GAMM|nr:arylesterase [Thiomicrorhabdus immobilis]BCN93767.1 arylesterase [Thiomicrorhabdus immobilis]
MLFLVILNPSLSFAQPQATIYEEKLNIAGDSAPISLLVMGDSLSAAYGLDVNQGWVALLQQKFPQFSVHNASISGETTSGGKQRLVPLLEKYQPAVLVIELGANDALRGQDLTVSQQNIQQMIDACLQYNQACKVVLLGVKLPTNYGPAYELMFTKMYQDLADKNPIWFDPFFIETVALDPDLMQWDGLHPNADAQPAILQRVAPLFEQLLAK